MGGEGPLSAVLGAMAGIAGDPLSAGARGILLQAYEEGRANYEGVAIPFDIYARRILQLVVLPRGDSREEWAEDLAERLGRSGGPDLYLAIACEEGVPGAWQAFQDRYEPRMRRIASARGARGFDIERLASEILGDLYTPAEGSGHNTRLGAYSGTGSLHSWLAAILRRKVSDDRRSRARSPVNGATGRSIDTTEKSVW